MGRPARVVDVCVIPVCDEGGGGKDESVECEEYAGRRDRVEAGHGSSFVTKQTSCLWNL